MTNIVLGEIFDLNNVLISNTNNKNEIFFMKIINKSDVINASGSQFNFPIFENQMEKLNTKKIDINNDIHPMTLLPVEIDDKPYFYILPNRIPSSRIIFIGTTDPISNFGVTNIDDTNIITIFQFNLGEFGKPQKTLYSGVEYFVRTFNIKPDCLDNELTPLQYRTTKIDTNEKFPGTQIWIKNFDKYSTIEPKGGVALLENKQAMFFQFTQLYNFDINNNCNLNSNLYESILQIGKANFINSGKCGKREIKPTLFSSLPLCFFNKTNQLLTCPNNEFCGDKDCYGPCKNDEQVCKIVEDKPTCVDIENNNISTIIIISVFILIFIIIGFIIFASRR